MPGVPEPWEYDLPDGDLAVATHIDSRFDPRAATVPAEKRPLYELLLKVCVEHGESVPDLMPAHLATHCEHLIDARETVTNVRRGSVNIPGAASYGMGFCYRVRDAIDAHRDRPPLRLVVVGCSGSKVETDDPVPAKARYDGAYWTCKRRYGETIANADPVGDVGWRIVSAEHALLHPATKIEPYERTPDDLRGIPVDSDQRLPDGDPVATLLDQWALRVYEGLQGWLTDVSAGVDPRDVALEVLVGRSYRDPLDARGVFEALRTPADLSISFPFQDEPAAQGGIGNQMGWASDAVAAAQEGSA